MYKVAMIGAGPGGIAMAYELWAAGVPSSEISMYEKAKNYGSSITTYYPADKLTTPNYKGRSAEIKGLVGITEDITNEAFMDFLGEKLKESGVQVTYDAEVTGIKQVGDHFSIINSKGTAEAQFIVLASGIFAKPRKPDYKIPSSVGTRASFDLRKFEQDKITGKTVLVVGGGDSSSEYTQSLVRMGNQVIHSYRQDKFFRMNDANAKALTDLSQNGKIQLLMGSNISGLEGSESHIDVRFESHPAIQVDYIVYSLGGASPATFLSNCGLDYDPKNVDIGPDRESAVPRLFVVGDLVYGTKGGSVIAACNDARTVMEVLHQKYQFPAPKPLG